MRHRLVIVLLRLALVIAASVAAGCSSGTSDTTTTTADATSSTAFAIDTTTTTADATSLPTIAEGAQTIDPSAALLWEPCSWGECATLAVPLDHDDPGAGTIDLSLARRVALAPDERIGVLLYNPGGPGASGVQILGDSDWPSDLFSRDLVRRFDIVSWDPRGASEGTEVLCGDEILPIVDPTPETPEEVDQIEEQYRDFVAACVEQSGHLLPHLSTVSTARDMDLIRAALGEDQISYLGQSYGAGLGAVYATLFPERVRAAVLDGAFTFSESDSSWGDEKALNDALEQCAADVECPFHSNGDPFTAFDDLMDSLDAEPLIVGGFEVGLADALFAVLVGLYYEERWPEVMQTLADARDGDGSGMTGLRWMLTNTTNMTTPLAVDCLDWRSREQADKGAEQPPADAPRVGVLTRPWEAIDLCSMWPVEPDPPPPLTAAGAGPILAIGTTGDIATTLAMARELVDELEDGVLLIVERNAHCAYMPGFFGRVNPDTQCVTSTVDSYLIDLKTPANGSICTHGDPELRPPE
jgi:pimeloyl-ACP methyl ester carboxylesterase